MFTNAKMTPIIAIALHSLFDKYSQHLEEVNTRHHGRNSIMEPQIYVGR